MYHHSHTGLKDPMYGSVHPVTQAKLSFTAEEWNLVKLLTNTNAQLKRKYQLQVDEKHRLSGSYKDTPVSTHVG